MFSFASLADLLHYLVDSVAHKTEGIRAAAHEAIDRDFAPPPEPSDPRDAEIAVLKAQLGARNSEPFEPDPRDAEIAALKAQLGE